MHIFAKFYYLCYVLKCQNPAPKNWGGGILDYNALIYRHLQRLTQKKQLTK